jgi:hypothetical protein
MNAMEEHSLMVRMVITPRFLFRTYLVVFEVHRQLSLVELRHRWKWVAVRGKNLVDRNLVDRNLVDRNLVDRNLVDRNLVDQHHRRLNPTLLACEFRAPKIGFTVC